MAIYRATRKISVADSNLELRRGGGFVLLAVSVFPPFVISDFFFYPKQGAVGPGPPGPSPSSAPWICFLTTSHGYLPSSSCKAFILMAQTFLLVVEG